MKTKNPLYVAWKRLGLVRCPLGGWREPMRSMNTKAQVHAAVIEIGTNAMSRQTLVRRYSWAIPTTAAIKWIVERCPKIVELGAGRGYWARLLADAGADVLAFDQSGRGDKLGRNQWHYIPEFKPRQGDWDHGFAGQTDHVFYPVHFGRAKVAAEHRDRTLMLCWPPYSTPMANDCLRFYQGEQVLFIGEYGGATGNKAFFNRLEREWEKIGDFDIPQWVGMHDAIYLYRRKAGQ